MPTPQEQNSQGVDKTSALNIKQWNRIFYPHDSTSSSSSLGSIGGQTSTDSSAFSNQSTPKPLRRTNSPEKKDDGSEVLDHTNPFSSEFDAKVTEMSTEGSANRNSEESLYATVDPSEKSPRKSSSHNSGVGDQSFTPAHISRYGAPFKSSTEDIKALHIDKVGSHTPLITSDKITNRFWPRARYAMQRKSSVAPMVGATFITSYLAAYTVLAYMQNKSMFIAFITNNPKFIIVPGIIAASLFAIGIICTVKQFCNTIEHQIYEKNPDKVLKKVLDLQPEGKIIKSVRLEYSNNTHSNFTFNTWKSHKGFIDIDEKVINRTSKIESVFNDRPVFTALLIGFVVANIALPLGLYAAGGMNNVATFYQSLIATDIGLSLLVASSVLALSILCLGVHYYNKTNCTNLGYSCEDLKGEYVNPRLIEEVKKQRVDVLGENHNKEAKCSSLEIDEVTVESYNYPTISIACC